MKNIKTVNIKDYALWSTDLFKNQPIVDRVVDIVSRLPVSFYDVSHEREKLQLSAIWRYIARRQYDNPYIEDLYYFHELAHIANLRYDECSFDSWRLRLSENELYASLMSEAFIYFYVPELNGKTFDNMWVNKFLVEDTLPLPKNITTLSGWPAPIEQVVDARRKLRLMSQSDDFNESWIIKFNRMRDNWLVKWQPHYKKIDAAMRDFERTSDTDKLAEFLAANSTNGVPFLDIIAKSS